MATTPQHVPATGVPGHLRETLLRVAGGAMVLAGVVLLLLTAADLLGAFGDPGAAYSVDGMTAAATLTPGAGPELPGQVFLVIPLFLVGGVFLAVGLSEGRVRAAAAACPGCGTRPALDARFCRSCGTPVP